MGATDRAGELSLLRKSCGSHSGWASSLQSVRTVKKLAAGVGAILVFGGTYVASELRYRQGLTRGEAVGLLQGRKSGYDSGLEEGKRIGDREGYDRGFKEGRDHAVEAAEEQLSRLVKPVMVVTNDTYGELTVSSAIFYNCTPWKCTNVKLVLNPDATGGGYAHKIQEIDSYECQLAGSGRFRNSNGQIKPSAAACVEATFSATLESGEEVRGTAIVFE